jgi:hypothetical protein
MPRYVAGTHFGVVTCDGVELDRVEEVDTDLGFAVVHLADENGRVVSCGDGIKRRLVIGKMAFYPRFSS